MLVSNSYTSLLAEKRHLPDLPFSDRPIKKRMSIADLLLFSSDDLPLEGPSSGTVASSPIPDPPTANDIVNVHSEDEAPSVCYTSDSDSFVAITVEFAKLSQKSYGSEKRFLCPPPLVRYGGNLFEPVTMSVLCENCDVVSEMAPAGPTEQGSVERTFRHLHVSSNSKSKQFQLQARLGNVVVNTPPITMISKPSKRHSSLSPNSTGSMLTVCIGDKVSLFNRINSQTVRTRYISCNSSQLTAQYHTWSSFTIHLVSASSISTAAPNKEPLKFGTVIQLRNSETGLSSEPLIVTRPLTGNKIASLDSSAVGQLNKVVLESRWRPGNYLSAPPETCSLVKTGTGSSNELMYTCLGPTGAFSELALWTIVGVGTIILL